LPDLSLRMFLSLDPSSVPLPPSPICLSFPLLGTGSDDFFAAGGSGGRSSAAAYVTASLSHASATLSLQGTPIASQVICVPIFLCITLTYLPLNFLTSLPLLQPCCTFSQASIVTCVPSLSTYSFVIKLLTHSLLPTRLCLPALPVFPTPGLFRPQG
jgi:hypothetical protein